MGLRRVPTTGDEAKEAKEANKNLISVKHKVFACLICLICLMHDFGIKKLSASNLGESRKTKAR